MYPSCITRTTSFPSKSPREFKWDIWTFEGQLLTSRGCPSRIDECASKAIDLNEPPLREHLAPCSVLLNLVQHWDNSYWPSRSRPKSRSLWVGKSSCLLGPVQGLSLRVPGNRFPGRDLQLRNGSVRPFIAWRIWWHFVLACWIFTEDREHQSRGRTSLRPPAQWKDPPIQLIRSSVKSLQQADCPRRLWIK